jgi:hypothetical protein
MTVQFKCDRCGSTVSVLDVTKETIHPPKGWRRIYFRLDVYTSDTEAAVSTYESEGLHVCPTCVAGLKADQHLDHALATLQGAECGVP